MNMVLDVQKKLLPDLMEVMETRYRILRFIRLMQPIGRRALSINLDMSERVLRSEVTFLKKQGLVEFQQTGMILSAEGQSVLEQLEIVMKEVFDIRSLEEDLVEKLGVREVHICPGDSDETPWVQKEMGRAAFQVMKNNLLPENNVIAVTGGRSIANVADMLIPDASLKETLFVPARGGLGEQVENQANTICATMARKAQGNYRLLHVPDQLSKEAYASLIHDPAIKSILEQIRAATMVVHGIGEAMTMAERRNAEESVMEKLTKNEAVAEAFGYYFDRSGEIVHKVLTIGLQLEDLERIPTVIAVAGGASKSEAITAYMKQSPNRILITDEGAAKEILMKL